jgi:anaerobic selenocysteine-containing dehydrogenase
MGAVEIEAFLVALAQHFGIGPADAVDLPLEHRVWLLDVAAELEQAGRHALVAVGHHLPPELQALGCQINHVLGALHHTLELTEPAAWRSEPSGSLADLAETIRYGEVDTLLMLDVNPVYSAPADLDFEALVQQVPLRIHLGQHDDETAAYSHWHVSQAHPFEGWSAARATCGTASVLQPLVRPLYGGHTVHEMLATLAGEPDLNPYEAVRATWRRILGETGFEEKWSHVLSDGFAPTTASPRVTATPRPIQIRPPRPAKAALEVVFRPDPSIGDGRFANNPWLHELPKPLTKLTWDNVAAISPALATARQLRNGDKVQLSAGERLLEAPVWLLPGQAEHTITLYLGYGRRRTGRVGDGIGYNGYRLRRADAPWRLDGIDLQAIDDAAVLAPHHGRQ